MRQLFFWDTGHPLEIIMTGVAKMSRPKAEEHSHRATVTTFILQEICPMFRAHLQQKEWGVNKLKEAHSLQPFSFAVIHRYKQSHENRNWSNTFVMQKL